jgi:hypothetical protein
VLRGVQRFHQELERSRSGEDGGMACWARGSLFIARLLSHVSLYPPDSRRIFR